MGVATPGRVRAFHIFASRTKRRVSILLDLTPATLFAIALLRMASFQTYAIEPLPRDGLLGRVARGLGVRYIEAESQGFTEFSEISRETPVEFSLHEVGTQSVRHFVSRLSSAATDSHFVEQVLEISLLREAQLRSDRLFLALLAVQTFSDRRSDEALLPAGLQVRASTRDPASPAGSTGDARSRHP